MSELEDYTYCPRAWWYCGHPPDGALDPAGRAEVLRGQRFHEERISAERWREDWAKAIAAVAIGSLLFLVAVLAWAVTGH